MDNLGTVVRLCMTRAVAYAAIYAVGAVLAVVLADVCSFQETDC